jgi:hypothetical protein
LLDLSHPKTPHVFAAARQLDLILEYVKKISYSESRDRLGMIQIIRPCFVALRWLNTNQFGNSPVIAESIDALEEQADRLAHSGDGGLVQIVTKSLTRCPVCDTPLTTSRPGCLGLFLEARKEMYCSNCLGPTMKAYTLVCSIEEGFATAAI